MSNREPHQALKTLSRQLNIAGVCITTAMLLGIAWFYLGPMSRSAAECRQHLDRLNTLLKEEHRLRAEHAELCKQLDHAAKQESLLQKRIPRGPQEAEFLAQISQAATEAGLQITDYRPGVISTAEAWSMLRVELACEGKYSAACALLDRLQRLSRYSTVSRLEVGPGASPGHYAIKLCLELYFFSDSRALATK